MADKSTVLIVDDNAANIMWLYNLLKSEYKCIVAKSGIDAINSAANNSPDIILLDVVMPDMDGYEVISLLKKDSSTKDIPVIFITGLDDDKNEAKGLALGAADYIKKTSDGEEAKLRIREQLQMRGSKRV